MTAPGVPDFYQGTELWDFNLVDPDNRRPVDFELRRKMLLDLKRTFACLPSEMPARLKQLLDELTTGKIKLYLIWRTLDFRREHRQLFDQGRYLPLSVFGSKQEHVFAFARVLGTRTVITLVPRLVLGLTGKVGRPPMGREIWQDTYIAASAQGALGERTRRAVPQFRQGERFRNLLTGEVIETKQQQQGLLVADALASFPVALLESLH
jgi:(1->4)-alpha-D-glucan 1-alpha-D-glucosylmutase